jgi:hypothetical protein
MKIFENPIEFEINKKFNEFDIRYTNLVEVCQGGPEIGKLTINGISFTDYLFGGPILFHDNKVYAPVFIKKTFKSGFQLAEIDLTCFEINKMGKIKVLIFLYKIEDSKIIIMRI